MDFGAPLHCLVLAGELHVTEREMLEYYMIDKNGGDASCRGDGTGASRLEDVQ